MDWRTKIALVVVVVGMGLAVALQFRKHGGEVSESSASSTSGKPAANDTASSPAAAHDKVPYQSTSLDHLSESASNTSAAAGDSNSAAPGATEASDTEKLNATGATGAMVELNAPQPTHRVADGDTLPKLAQQYLGRSDRYLEIFDYNRDVLQSPDILPIGAELRIPSRLAMPAADSGIAKNAPSSTTASAPATAAPPLVPLVSPTAKPATVAKTPRTYTVQRGDNLVDIARKMYGDGRRHQDLYESNRGVMHYPGDLKPGMVLVIP